MEKCWKFDDVKCRELLCKKTRFKYTGVFYEEKDIVFGMWMFLQLVKFLNNLNYISLGKVILQ